MSITPLRGPAGTTVQVDVSGFPAQARLDLGAGRLDTEYTVLASGVTDAQGRLTTTLAVPSQAQPGEPWVVVAALASDPSLKAVSNIFSVTGQAGAGGTYTVQPGDTLSRIARQQGVSLNDLLAANPGITNPSLIFVGQSLVLPGQDAAQPSVSISPTSGAPGTPISVTARGFRADTRVEVGVSQQGSQPSRGIDSAHVTGANGALSAQIALPDTAAVGEAWVVHVTTLDQPRQSAVSSTFSVVAPASDPAARTYTIQPGDNLWRISRRFGTTVDALLRANPAITDGSLIYAGQTLAIPSGADPGPSASLTPLRGPAGSPVQVNASGLPSGAPVTVGVGPANSEPVVTYGGLSTDAEGRLATTVAVPPSAEAGEVWAAVVSTTGANPMSAVTNIFAVTQPSAGDEPVTSVPVYLVALNAGQLGCGDALRAVTRSVPATTEPWRAALSALLAVDDTTTTQAGLYNALAPSDLRLDSVEIDAQGQADVRLSGDFQIGGVCDAPRLEAQLEQTALQFSPIRQVEVFINGQPLDSLLSGQG